MHEFLRAIGFSGFRTKKQLKQLTDWVLEKPDSLSIVASDEDPESNLAEAKREISGNAGIAVVGEIDEKGMMVPEYYFPYITSACISSDAHLTYERESTRNAYIGMCEDYRMGMALIFSVSNVGEVVRAAQETLLGDGFREVAFSALAKDGTVLLPLAQTEKVLKQSREEAEYRTQLMEDASAGDVEAAEGLAEQEMKRYQHVMDRIHESDVFTLVESFFMPFGMESDQYYFLGKILACQEIENELTGEKFYRMAVESNGMELAVAINAQDLDGVPAAGARLKCHAWLLGEMKH